MRRVGGRSPTATDQAGHESPGAVTLAARRVTRPSRFVVVPPRSPSPATGNTAWAKALVELSCVPTKATKGHCSIAASERAVRKVRERVGSQKKERRQLSVDGGGEHRPRVVAASPRQSFPLRLEPLAAFLKRRRAPGATPAQVPCQGHHGCSLVEVLARIVPLGTPDEGPPPLQLRCRPAQKASGVRARRRHPRRRLRQ